MLFIVEGFLRFEVLFRQFFILLLVLEKLFFKRLLFALFYSLDGFKSAWKHEHSFRQELVMVVGGVIIALALPVPAFQKLMLIMVLLLIPIVELINSAIEAVVDRVSLERHTLSKNAKDFGSAAVLLTCIIALATWSVVLYERFS